VFFSLVYYLEGLIMMLRRYLFEITLSSLILCGLITLSFLMQFEVL